MAMGYGGFRPGRGSSPIQGAVGGRGIGSTGLFDSILKNRPMLGNRGMQQRGPQQRPQQGMSGFLEALGQLLGSPGDGGFLGGGQGGGQGMWNPQMPATPVLYDQPTGDPRPPTPGYGGPNTVPPQTVGGNVQQPLQPLNRPFGRGRF